MNMTHPIYTNADKAREHLESLRWPNGPVCAHCSCVGRISKMQGKSTRPGVYKCNDCRKFFSVTVGTVFERSKIALNLWVLATHLMAASKKGMSAHQLHRMLGVTYKTAWFMAHRIREAMRNDDTTPFGGNGGVVEVDETFIGREPRAEVRRGFQHKMKVLSLVDRDTKRAKSMVVDDLKGSTLVPILRENIAKEAVIHTDEAGQYTHLGRDFAGHDFVRHSAREYGRGEVHTNTIEGYFSIFKRGMKGICPIPDDHISPRRSAFFMARSVLRDIREGMRPC